MSPSSLQKRVLIVGLTNNKGGLETFIMELYRRIDRSLIQFDFLHYQKDMTHLAYEDEILSLGGRIYYCPMIRNGPIEHYRCLNRVFKQTQYQAVYYQANNKIKNADIFRIAKKYNVPLCLLHSHNSAVMRRPSLYKYYREKIAAHVAKRYVTHYFSCSKEAGAWMFGDSINYKVVNNGIDTECFDYKPDTRNLLRQQEHAEEKVVYGTVGRFSKIKNPLFLVDIFNEIHKLQPDSVFWHIGGNYLEQQALVREKISHLGLEDSYLLLGVKDNVYDYLNAMDLFLLPSIHEGFPISLVEAQDSGLRCLVSDNITKDVNLTGNVYFCSLKESAKKWAETAIHLTSYKRESCRQILVEKGYDVNTRVAEFEKLILSI